MSRIYVVTFQAVAVTANQDLVEITMADDKPIELVEFHLGQSTEIGDAQEEQMRWSVVRGHATGGSGGSAPTPAPLNPNDAAAGFTAEVNNTTIGSAGSPVTVWADTFNIRSGLAQIWLPEARVKASQGATTLIVRLLTTPTDSITYDGTLVVAELI